jgi:hypothetical protein
MPLVILLFGLLVPRVVIVLLWLLTAWFQGMFATLLLPVLGFIFLPTTLLWYSVVQNWFKGQWNVVALVGLVIAFVLDVGPLMRRRRRTVVISE